MLKVFQTMDELKKDVDGIKKDIEEIKSNIRLLMSSLIQNQNMAKLEMIDFMSNRESSNNRFYKARIKEKVFDISFCEYIVNESKKHSFTRLDEDSKVINIDQITPVCNMLSTELNDNILPSIISLYDLKTTQHISVNVVDLFIAKCKKHINIHSKPTFFSLCIPLKNNIEIEINREKMTVHPGDLIIYCGNKEANLSSKQLCIIINVEFEYHS
jgi:hypothetical protein